MAAAKTNATDPPAAAHMVPEESVKQSLELITRRLPPENVSRLDVIENLLRQGKAPRCLWATSPTGKPHIGYWIPMLKLVDFIDAGAEITIYLLDIYSFVDNVVYPMEQVVQRMLYYKFLVQAMLETLGVPPLRVRYVQESTCQLTERFQRDFWRLATLVPQQAIRDSWDRAYYPHLMGPMLAPLFQALSEEHLGVDFQFGGADQRGLFMLAERYIPQLGYSTRAHLMTVMLPSLVGGNMSSAKPPSSKVMLLDTPDSVRRKILDTMSAHHQPSHQPSPTQPNATSSSSTAAVNGVLHSDSEQQQQQQQQQSDAQQAPPVNKRTRPTDGMLLAIREILQPAAALWHARARASMLDGRGLFTPEPPFWRAGAPDGTFLSVECEAPQAPAAAATAAETVREETEEEGKQRKNGGQEGRQPRHHDGDDEYRHYATYEAIERDLDAGALSCEALLAAVAAAFNRLHAPLHRAFAANAAWQAATRAAYPEES